MHICACTSGWFRPLWWMIQGSVLFCALCVFTNQCVDEQNLKFKSKILNLPSQFVDRMLAVWLPFGSWPSITELHWTKFLIGPEQHDNQVNVNYRDSNCQCPVCLSAHVNKHISSEKGVLTSLMNFMKAVVREVIPRPEGLGETPTVATPVEQDIQSLSYAKGKQCQKVN